MDDPIPSAEPWDQPLGGDTALWLIEKLPPYAFEADSEPCQEDWGWVVFASRGSHRFWVGTSPMFEGNPPEWIIHLHHWDFSIAQRFTKAGRKSFSDLAFGINQILAECPEITDVRWHFNKDVLKNRFQLGSAHPEAG